MRWVVEIAAEQPHLEALAAAFPVGDLRIEENGAGWVMSGDAVAGSSSATEALEQARALLPRLNGIGRAKLPGLVPIVVEARVRDLDDPARGTSVFGEAHLTLYATMGGPPVGGLRALNERMDKDWDLAEAIRLLGIATDVGWGDLFKVFEVLRKSAGGEAAFAQRVGITKHQVSIFKFSCNSADVSGDGARHSVGAGPQGTPQQKPLTLVEGREFIVAAIAAWH